ncbi:uncharacterized protein LOC108736459 [Agrilus planipennis]|uniref:Uncharacterized protein LOC108736459 n=1 Tax=Agrilus planipennis TaxID=224129 RepID=A0A1W4WV73_AGRPL|nr:uncharacterized protein LOC108736459 [Agrilus planipennis]
MTGKLIVVCVVGISFVLSKPNNLKQYQRVKRGNSYENMTFTFDCTNKPVGFYADQEYNCNVFHMCDEKGTRIPHACASGTSFNQEYRICDWDYNFNCSEAHKWYYLNSLTYATEENQDDIEEL